MGQLDVLPDLAASCYGLEKLSIRCHDEHLKVEEKEIDDGFGFFNRDLKDPMEPRINRIEAKFFKCIIQN